LKEGKKEMILKFIVALLTSKISRENRAFPQGKNRISNAMRFYK
jgi:hypothetical protein